jgi:hypothetical protein
VRLSCSDLVGLDPNHALTIIHLDGSSPHRRVHSVPEPPTKTISPDPDLPLHPARSAHSKYYRVRSTICAEAHNTAVGLAMAAMKALLGLSPRHTSAKPTYQGTPQGH